MSIYKDHHKFKKMKIMKMSSKESKGWKISQIRKMEKSQKRNKIWLKSQVQFQKKTLALIVDSKADFGKGMRKGRILIKLM